MKAAVLNAYRKNDFDLDIVTMPDPVAGPGEVLVRVAAAGVNPLDNLIARGELRQFVDYEFPQVAGCEIVGYVEACGKGVDTFSPGDRVCARMPVSAMGAFATVCTVPASALAKAPAHMSDVQAAAVPLVALAAVQAFELLEPEADQTLFLAGASGGFGQVAVPLAKERGLKVVASGNGEVKARLEALGVDRFIDYRREQFDQVLSDIDLVVDAIGGTYIERELSVMRRGGRMVSLRGVPNRRFAERSKASGSKRMRFSMEGRSIDHLADKRGVTYDFLLSDADGAELAGAIAVLEKRGAVPTMDSTFDFHDVNLALRNVARKGSKGKTVLIVNEALCR